MKRVEQITLIITFLGFCWLGMQAVHELGHVLAARATGGTIQTVVLYPTMISRTEVFPNPHPLIEVWAGPVLGSLIPLAVYGIATLLRSPGLYLYRFFAGFCLVANGGYLIAGTIERMGDPGELLRHGARGWQIIPVGLLLAIAGFCLWNGMGRHFGIGNANGRVSREAVISSFLLLIVVLAGEFVLGHA